MGNSVFHFKQFSIAQERCAMKVSTDACLLGAWMPLEEHVQRVLDIGTGTALLPLMLAQRNPNLHIDAIEIEPEATQQAMENIQASPWKDRITVHTGDVQTFAHTAQPYDAIISNPPFFANSLLGDTESRNRARHTLQLSHHALAGICRQLLKPNGYAAILLPHSAYAGWQATVQASGMGISQTLIVKPRAESVPTRIITICRPGYTGSNEEQELVVHEPDHSYTPAFFQLLQPFYQKL